MTVGVVGGGVTGLAAAHYLDERGVDAVVFEAGSEPGGVVRSERVDGFLLERGPQRIRRTDLVGELIDDLGLADETIAADPDLPLYVYCDGKLREVPRSLPAFLTTDLLSASGKLRVLAEPFTAPGRPEETAAELFERKFGGEAYRNVLGPLFGGTFGSEPERMPAEHALSGLLALEEREGSLLKPALRRAGSGSTPPAISFDDGLQRLPEALYVTNSGRIRLDAPVTGIGRVEDGWEIGSEAGSTVVSEVVVTTPADVTADVVAQVAPAAGENLERLEYNPLALVYLRGDTDLRGMGYQIRHDEGFGTLGVSWNASLFDRDGIYTCFLGGMANPDLVDRPDDELGRTAREEFEAVTGVAAEVIDVHRLRRGFPAYDGSWSALDDVTLPDGIHLATNYTGRMGIPSRIREARELAGTLA